jgi:hypothetical protein
MVELGLDEDEGHEEVELGMKKWSEFSYRTTPIPHTSGCP